MKKIIFTLLISAAAVVAVSSCGFNGKYNAGDVVESITPGQNDTVAYALGVFFANMMEQNNFGELSYAQIQKGFEDALAEKAYINPQQVGTVMQDYFQKRQEYLQAKALEEGTKFLEENKNNEGVITTESGLQYKVLVEGTGAYPTEDTDVVEVNYEGRFLNGDVFDSSYERGQSTEFALNRVIKGWTEGIKYINEGGKIELYIPSELAYGVRGNRGIPGNSTLIFQVELIKVKKPEAKAEPEKRITRPQIKK